MKKQLAIVFIQSMLCLPVYAWTIHADFDDGALNERADQGNDGFHSDGQDTRYSNTQKLKGNSASVSVTAGEEGFGSWGGTFGFPQPLTKGETVWFQAHLYYPSGYDNYAYSAGGRLKFFRLHTRPVDAFHCCYNDILWEGAGSPSPLVYIFEGQDELFPVGTPADEINFDVWESFQIVITLDNVSKDNGGAGETRIYKNDKLIQRITGSKTLKEADHVADFSYLFSYWNGGAPKTQTMWIDEITFTNETPTTVDDEGFPVLKSLISIQPVLEEPTRQ